MNRIPASTWAEIRTAYASGIGLREIARNTGIPPGTVLARASRERWTRHIEAAKSLAKSVEQAIVPTCEAVAVTMRERGEQHVERMAGITDKLLPHLEQMEPGEILNSARNLERYDYVARRSYRLDHQPPATGGIHIGVLTGQVAIQYKEQTDSRE